MRGEDFEVDGLVTDPLGGETGSWVTLQNVQFEITGSHLKYEYLVLLNTFI